METAIQFLERVYLPGYITILDQDFSGNKARFDFRPIEPPVTVLSDRYLTPRGTHILLSQGAYCFSEKLMIDNDLFDRETIERWGLAGRLKLVEFNQKFRKEINLSDTLQGRLTLTRLRPGKIPIVQFDFELGYRASTGNMTGLVSPKPTPQTNADILRL